MSSPTFRFRLLPGVNSHHHNDGVTYREGDILETTDSSLMDKFPLKFERIRGRYQPDEVDTTEETDDEVDTTEETVSHKDVKPAVKARTKKKKKKTPGVVKND